MTEGVTRDWFDRDGTIAVRLDDTGILTIRLNRPERLNALTRPMLNELGDIFEKAGASPAVRAIILTGEGRAFCSGADAQSLADSAKQDVEQRLAERPRFTPRMVNIWKPSICAVNGICAGAGLHFVADFDIIIAGESASFTDTHVNVGQVTGMEPVGLARRMPLGAVLRLVTLGKAERLSAAKALELHLVSEVLPDSELLPRAHALATIIAGVSPAAVQRSLEAVWESFERPLSEGYDLGYEMVMRHRDHPDAAEGPAAFLEKRTPNWTA
ncbi:enoyl-CoA hydratase/isomerase family protein [Sphingopyxis sp.]|uniref:enoyl-CoA hydratase/isomerase family protein n=1 Tax=Sphingopyxis sp. TaxID=1908224 RepID=UPI003D6CD2C4